MFNVDKIHLTSDKELFYKAIFKKVFSEQDIKESEYQSPSILYLGREDDNIIGFASGYATNKISFYIQYAGVIPDKRGNQSFRYFNEGLKKINEDYKIINCMIKNTNIPAIKMVLKACFIVVGMRNDSGNNLYVEFTRRSL